MGMTLNIIFDERHSADKQRLLLEFKEQGIDDFRFHNAIVLTDSVIDSIAASHKMIIQDAKDRGLKECIIGEQDLHFTCPTAWKYFMDSKPKDDYDLYLACTYTPPISNGIVCGFHLYIIHERFYDALLGVSRGQHIDTAMDKLGGRYVFCYPFPALQRSGWSANNRIDCNYNVLLSEQDIYKG